MDEQVFNLDRKIDSWTNQLKSDSSFTENDAEELKSHFYDITDELKKKGLDEEEADLIARKRLGEQFELEPEFAEANKPIIHIRRSLLILAGVLAYFIIYYFILSTSKMLIMLLLIADVGKMETVEWTSRYLITWHFVIVIFFASLYFLESRIISFLEKLKLKPKGTIYLLAVTALLAIIDTCLYPIIKNMMERNVSILSMLFQHYNYFDFSFPFIIGAGFIFIYYKYYKKAKF